MRQSDMLVASAALPLPALAKYVVAVLAVDKFGAAAVVYGLRMHEGLGPPLLLCDFDLEPMNIRLFRKIGERVRELAVQCKARGSVVFVYPAELLSHAQAVGLVAEQVPDGIEPENLLLSASNHVSSGAIKLCEDAFEKSKTAPFSAAMDFRSGEQADAPLRQAALLTIGLSLDVPQ